MLGNLLSLRNGPGLVVNGWGGHREGTRFELFCITQLLFLWGGGEFCSYLYIPLGAILVPCFNTFALPYKKKIAHEKVPHLHI